MSQRRQVRVSPSFFDRLVELLPAERSASGAPSTAEFLLHEIPPLIDVLAVNYDKITLAVEGVPGVRVLIAAGVLVPYVARYTVLASDVAIEIIYLGKKSTDSSRDECYPVRLGQPQHRPNCDIDHGPAGEQSHHTTVRPLKSGRYGLTVSRPSG